MMPLHSLPPLNEDDLFVPMPEPAGIGWLIAALVCFVLPTLIGLI